MTIVDDERWRKGVERLGRISASRRGRPPRPRSTKVGPLPAASAIESFSAKLGPVATTMATQASCPKTCPLLHHGCFTEFGALAYTTGRRNAAPETNRSEIARIEAAAIRRLPGRLDLRLHTVGDCSTNTAAWYVAQAAMDYMAKHGRQAWTYTHASATVDRETWGTVSVLASCETVLEVETAIGHGYATSLIVDEFKEPRAYALTPYLRGIPCPEQLGKPVTCASCRLCMKDKWLRKTGTVILFRAHNTGRRDVLATLAAKEIRSGMGDWRDDHSRLAALIAIEDDPEKVNDLRTQMRKLREDNAPAVGRVDVQEDLFALAHGGDDSDAIDLDSPSASRGPGRPRKQPDAPAPTVRANDVPPNWERDQHLLAPKTREVLRLLFDRKLTLTEAAKESGMIFSSASNAKASGLHFLRRLADPATREATLGQLETQRARRAGIAVHPAPTAGLAPTPPASEPTTIPQEETMTPINMTPIKLADFPIFNPNDNRRTVGSALVSINSEGRMLFNTAAVAMLDLKPEGSYVTVHDAREAHGGYVLLFSNDYTTMSLPVRFTKSGHPEVRCRAFLKWAGLEITTAMRWTVEDISERCAPGTFLIKPCPPPAAAVARQRAPAHQLAKHAVANGTRTGAAA